MGTFHRKNFPVTLFVVFFLFAQAIARNCKDDPNFRAFKSRYSKCYSCDRTEVEAYTNFLCNERKVAAYNSEYALNHTSQFFGLNENSDIDAETWLNATSGFILDPSPVNCTARRSRQKRNTVPATLDYQKSGLTTPVQNQGTCGSCYAFAAAAAIEGQAIKLSGDRRNLSPQQILDCSSKNGNFGCNGGFSGKTFDYVSANGGLTSSALYPYSGRVRTCSSTKPVVTMTGHTRYGTLNVETLKQHLASVGPLVCAINSKTGLNPLYKGGIIDNPNCASAGLRDLDHAILLVGYGTENGVNYWKVKNSWGTSWGEQGYFRIRQDRDCGIRLDVYAPGATKTVA